MLQLLVTPEKKHRPPDSCTAQVADIFDKLYRNLGTVYSELGEREKALYYFERAVTAKKGLQTWSRKTARGIRGKIGVWHS